MTRGMIWLMIEVEGVKLAATKSIHIMKATILFIRGRTHFPKTYGLATRITIAYAQNIRLTVPAAMTPGLRHTINKGVTNL